MLLLGKLLHMVLGQALQLHIAPSPAAGAVNTIELKRTAQATLRTVTYFLRWSYPAAVKEALPVNRVGNPSASLLPAFAEVFGQHIVLSQPLFICCTELESSRQVSFCICSVSSARERISIWMALSTSCRSMAMPRSLIF